jgi:signal peptidase I
MLTSVASTSFSLESLSRSKQTMLGNFVKYCLRIFTIAISLVLVALACSLIVVRQRGYQVMSVESNSMAPQFAKGDAIILDRRPMNLRTGMIVSYISPKDSRVTITHRIVAIDRIRGTIQTKGDNLLTPDPIVPMAAVQGTVQYHITYGGIVLDWLRTPAGLAVIIYLPAFGIIISEIRRLQRVYSGSFPGHYVLRGY